MKKVIIVGGGFGGLSCALKLSNKKNIEVLLIDRNNHHLFLPLLYQVAMGGLNPSDIAIPFRLLLKKAKNINFIQDDIKNINFNKQEVEGDNNTYSYDKLVLALGTKPAKYRLPNDKGEIPGVKSLVEAINIREQVYSLLEEADQKVFVNKSSGSINFAILGGGPTGVEMAGALAELVNNSVPSQYKNLKKENIVINLIENRQSILSAFSSEIATKGQEQLEKLGVSVNLNCNAKFLSKTSIEINGVKQKCDLVIMAAGVKPQSLIGKLNLEKDKFGKIIVNKKNQAHENVYAIGDCCSFYQDGLVLPDLAPVAIEQGQFVAKNILGLGKDKFKFQNKGMMATIGRSKAIFEYKKLRISGSVAWLLWVFVHLLAIICFKNRLTIFTQWFFSYFTFGKQNGLITRNIIK